MRLLPLAALLLVACSTAPAPVRPPPREQLVGRWQSNRATTIAHLEDYTSVTAERRALLASIHGELVLEFEPGWWAREAAEGDEAGTYSFVAEGPNYVDLELAGDCATRRRFFVEGDRLWTWVEQVGFFEYFDRLP